MYSVFCKKRVENSGQVYSKYNTWYKTSTINYVTCTSYTAITRHVATKDKDNKYATWGFKNNIFVH